MTNFFFNTLKDFKLLDISVHQIEINNKILNTLTNFDIYINNPNLVLIIIENLSLGIIIPIGIALKFDYINKLYNHDGFEKNSKYQINIVRIDKNWDTNKFSFSKLINFNKYFYYIENHNIEEIKNFDWELQYIDVHFLEALSWNGKLKE